MKKTRLLALTMLCSIFCGMPSKALEIKDSSSQNKGTDFSNKKVRLDDSDKMKMRKAKDTNEESSITTEVISSIVIILLISGVGYKCYYSRKGNIGDPKSKNLQLNSEKKPEKNLKKPENKKSQIDTLFGDMCFRYGVSSDSDKNSFYWGYFQGEKFIEYVPGTFDEAYNMYKESKESNCTIIKQMSKNCSDFLREKVLFNCDKGKFDFFIGYDGKFRGIYVCPKDGLKLQESVIAKISCSEEKKFVKLLTSFA